MSFGKIYTEEKSEGTPLLSQTTVSSILCKNNIFSSFPTLHWLEIGLSLLSVRSSSVNISCSPNMARWDIDNTVSVDTKRQYLAKWSQYLNYHQIFSANIVSDFDSSCVVESSKIARTMMSSIGSIDKNVFDLVEWRSLVTFITFFFFFCHTRRALCLPMMMM